MICPPCVRQRHDECIDCPCQHRPVVESEPELADPGGE